MVARAALRPGGAAVQQHRARQAQHHQRQRCVHQLLQQVQRGVVAPVQVVGQQQHRLSVFGGQRLQQRHEGGVGTVTQLARVHGRQVRAGRVVQPDQLPQQVDGRLAVSAQQRHQHLFKTLARAVGTVAVGNLQPVRQHVAQQPVGLAQARGLRTRQQARHAQR
jgi:hypothetical protein